MDAGVVDQDVDASGGGRHPFHEPGHLVLQRHVNGLSQDPPALAPQFLGGIRQQPGVDVAQRHGGAAGGQLTGKCQAHAAAGSGDQGGQLGPVRGGHRLR